MMGAKYVSNNTYNIHEWEILLYTVGILYIKMHFYIFEYEYIWFYIGSISILSLNHTDAYIFFRITFMCQIENKMKMQKHM